MITLRVSEENPITIKYVEAKVKPETECNVTPEPNSQTILPTPGTTFGQVNVSPIPSEYVIPTGTKLIGTNGLHNVAAYEQVNVDVHEVPQKGVIFSDFNSDGCPTSVTTYGFTALPGWYFYDIGYNRYNRTLVMGWISHIYLNEGITDLTADSIFREMVKVTEIQMPSTLERIGGTYLFNNTPLTLLDMSLLNSVPTLTTAGLSLASGCTIRVKQELLTEWQSANNWSSLTNIVWEGV